MKPEEIYILDSFAIIAYLKDEKGADKVEAILNKGIKGHAEIYIHMINLGEIFYVIFREAGEIQADAVYGKVKRYPVKFVEDLSEDFLLTAARIKGRYPIAYADVFAVATAVQKGGCLVTGDPELKEIEKNGEVKILWL